SHRARKGHHDKTIFIASHRLQNIRSLSELAAGKSCFRHRADKVVDGFDLGEIERLERNQAVFDRIVEFAINPGTVTMSAVPLLFVMAVPVMIALFQDAPPS